MIQADWNWLIQQPMRLLAQHLNTLVRPVSRHIEKISSIKKTPSTVFQEFSDLKTFKTSRDRVDHTRGYAFVTY